MGAAASAAVVRPSEPSAALPSGLWDGIDALLLDFDGPCAPLFAEADRPALMAALAAAAARGGGVLPVQLRQTGDPMAALTWVQGQPDLVRRLVEARLSELEVDLARAVPPTPGLIPLWTAARQRGLAVAIVTNNSARAVRVFLARWLPTALGTPTPVVVGRDPHRLDELKPAASPVLRAAEALGVPATRCLMLGDSASDLVAARTAGARAVAQVRRVAKRAELVAAGPLALVSELAQLAETLTS